MMRVTLLNACIAVSSALTISARPAAPAATSLPTPAAYAELLAAAGPDDVSIIRFGSPFCRTCREPSQLVDQLLDQYGSTASLYSIELVQDGKAAGRRMLKLFKEREVTAIPYLEVHRGDQCIHACVDKALAAQPCIVTPTAVSCGDDDQSRPLHRLQLREHDAVGNSMAR